MTTADKVAKITSQLIGDISRLEGVTLDQAGEAQLAQLIIDAFEAVGYAALEEWEAVNKPVINDTRCTLANCALGYPHNHSATVQVSAYPGDIVT